MKIIYLHQYFALPSLEGGTRSYDLSKKFIEKGYKVEFISSTHIFPKKEFKDRWKVMEIDGAKYNILYSEYDNSMGTLQRIIAFFRFVWYSSRKILQIKGDIIIASSTPLTIGIPAIIKKLFHKTPFIFEVRDVWPEAVIAIGAIKNIFLKKVLYSLESVIYKNSNAIIPLSTDMEKSIHRRFKNLCCPIQVIENISELDRFRKGYDVNFSILKEKLGFVPRFTVLYAGTIGKVNGISYTIELAKKIAPLDSTIVFILIGAGGERESVIELSKQKGVLGKNLFILDTVSKNELPQFYHEVQMGSSFVIPIKELWANSANKFFDTLAAEKPVLINYQGWQKELLLKKDAGYILPEDVNKLDHMCLTKFIEYSKNEKRQNLQQKNSSKLAERFSLEKAALKYVKIIEEVLLSK